MVTDGKLGLWESLHVLIKQFPADGVLASAILGFALCIALASFIGGDDDCKSVLHGLKVVPDVDAGRDLLAQDEAAGVDVDQPVAAAAGSLQSRYP